jgi:hypothetical protein
MASPDVTNAFGRALESGAAGPLNELAHHRGLRGSPRPGRDLAKDLRLAAEILLQCGSQTELQRR